MRAIAAGADALCLGHDLFDDDVVRVRGALVSAVEARRVSEERLAEAAAQVETLATWAAAARGAADFDRAAGRDAAQRALRIDGDVRIVRPACIVELVPEVGMAAGRLSQLPGEWFQAAAIRNCPTNPG